MEWIGLLLIGAMIYLAVSGALFDRRAKKAVVEYCRSHGIEIIEPKVYKNAFGVYFRVNGERKHSRFQFRKGIIEWESDPPLEIIKNTEQGR